MRITHAFLILFLARSLSALSPDDSSSLTTPSLADPDFLSSGLSWTSAFVPCAKVGGTIPFKRLRVGAMLEARNEARFNQALLPNHKGAGSGR